MKINLWFLIEIIGDMLEKWRLVFVGSLKYIAHMFPNQFGSYTFVIRSISFCDLEIHFELYALKETTF